MDAASQYWPLATIVAMAMAVFAALFILRRQVLREGFSESARMARALTSARKAAQRGSPERKPRKWVRGQMRLAMLLCESGGRSHDRGELEEAAGILAAAIPVLEQEKLHNELATAIYYRARAEGGLGNKALDTAGLETAFATLQHLLTFKPWPRHLLRAVILALSGVNLVEIGERLGDTARMEAGLSLCREAAEIARRRIRVEWCIARRILSHALGTLGRHTSDPALLEEAIAAAREAAGAIKRDSDPYQWVSARAELGFALGTLGGLNGDGEMLEESLSVLEEAMLASGPGLRGSGKAMLARHAGGTGTALGRLTGNPIVLHTAVGDLRTALAAFEGAGLPFAEAETARMLGQALAELSHLEGGPEAPREAVAQFTAALEIYNAAGAAKQAGDCEEALRALESGETPGAAAGRITPRYVAR